MKIGILTFHYALNYGAVLQAYALQRYLEDIGHNVEFINFIPKQKVQKKLTIRNFFTKIIDFYTNFRLEQIFKYFINHKLCINKIQYNKIEEIDDNLMEFDAFITGSDQVWAKNNNQYIYEYFLLFASNNQKKISYAASLGTENLNNDDKNEILKLIDNIDCISIREKSCLKIFDHLKKIINVVIDPTLLPINYNFINKPKYKKYILVYRLPQTSRLTQMMTKIIKRIEKLLNVNVINISPSRHRFFQEYGKTVYPSPDEWVSLIKNAEMVITNSFHGTVFSLIYNIPFIVLPRSENIYNNNRVIDLLTQFNLKKHYIEQIDDLQINLSEYKIDKEQVSKILNELQIKSIKFIKSSLQ